MGMVQGMCLECSQHLMVHCLQTPNMGLNKPCLPKEKMYKLSKVSMNSTEEAPWKLYPSGKNDSHEVEYVAPTPS
eukprot:7235071-Ditylum_brightwellii.AAC.1